jgi:predicted transcriptional regulator YheO
MRGSVDEVASMLGVSRTAVYNYLNEVNANRGDGAGSKQGA